MDPEEWGGFRTETLPSRQHWGAVAQLCFFSDHKPGHCSRLSVPSPVLPAPSASLWAGWRHLFPISPSQLAPLWGPWPSQVLLKDRLPPPVLLISHPQLPIPVPPNLGLEA